MSTNQPTVLVKKADGTFARMTLEEIKKMRGGVAPAVVQKVKTLPEQILRSAQDDNGRRSLVGASLVRDDKQQAKIPTIPTRVNQVEEVLKKLRFKVPEQLQNRLRSIIQLRLKDIRSVNQTKDKITQPAIEGGLGLGTAEAEELVSVCGIILDREIKNSNLADVPVLKKKKLLPMVEPNEIPAVATPFNAFVHGENGKQRRTPPLNLPLKEVETAKTTRDDKRGVLSMKPAVKVVMEDVQAPRPVEMGPVEEIQYMNLVDFRRLSAKPVEAAARLKQKFLNLRDESVVLYLDALTAWHKSPLYMDYMRNITRALKEKRKISALEGEDNSKIKLEEILAIVNMEKELE